MDDTFRRIWQEFQGELAKDPQAACALADAFQQKMEEVVFSPLRHGHTRSQLAQAKYMLQEEYHAWRRSIPEHHIRTAGKHRCVAAVYEDCYDRLHLMELQLRPALNAILDYHELTKPAPLPPVPQPVQPEYPDLALGEIEE